MKCSVRRCQRDRRHLAWCGRHYAYQRLHGRPEIPDPPIQPLHISRYQAIWLAAVIDCEGWIGFARAKRPRGFAYWISVGVGNTNKTLTNRLYQLTKMGRTYHIKKLTNPNAKEQYHWVIAKHDDVKRFLKTIRPFLLLKQRQADLLLSLPPKHTKAKRLKERINSILKKLNHRGRTH